MINKKMGLILAASIIVTQFARQPQSDNKKNFLWEHKKIESLEQVNHVKNCRIHTHQNNFKKDGLDSPDCANCKFVNNCFGCSVNTNNDSKEWISLDELPQLESL